MPNDPVAQATWDLPFSPGTSEYWEGQSKKSDHPLPPHRYGMPVHARKLPHVGLDYDPLAERAMQLQRRINDVDKEVKEIDDELSSVQVVQPYIPSVHGTLPRAFAFYAPASQSAHQA